jgi:hypothetical protein
MSADLGIIRRAVAVVALLTGSCLAEKLQVELAIETVVNNRLQSGAVDLDNARLQSEIFPMR